MPEALQTRLAVAEDVPAILELMKKSLGEGKIPRDAKYFRWKHFDNPFGQSPGLLALDGERIVGLRVFMRWTWRSGERRIPAVRAVDTATHPDYQGRGIFKRLTLDLVERMREEGVGFVFNTPNSKSMPGYLKMGWTLVGRPTVWVRLSRPLQAVRHAMRGDAGEWAGSVEDGDGSIEELLRQPRAAELLEPGAGHRADARLWTEPTGDYLHWRYAQPPGFTYRARWSFSAGGAAALIYRRQVRKGLRELTLAEVLVGPGARSIAQASRLLWGLAHASRADILVGCAALRSTSGAALALSGFAPVPNGGPHFTVRPLAAPTAGESEPLKLQSWRYTLGDLELF